MNPSVHSSGIGTGSTVLDPPSANRMVATVGNRSRSTTRRCGTYSAIQNSLGPSSSRVKMTTGPPVTRRSSARPAAGSGHWWMVKIAIAASTEAASSESDSATLSIAGTAPAAMRCARIAADGSTASTFRSTGS